MKNLTSVSPVNISRLTRNIASKAHRLDNAKSLDPLMERIGDARIVLLGESSHGTHEYYTWRSRISQRLIREKDFSFIAVEGDWPDCYNLNRYVKNYPNSGQSAQHVMKSFNRWPTWMWANWETVALGEWMAEHNKELGLEKKIGFYGLDVYSLWESLAALVQYLDKVDPHACQLAKTALECFETYSDKEGISYARVTDLVPESCREEVVNILTAIRSKMRQYESDREVVFNAEQNAIIAVNAELYYRSMTKSGPGSWNLRDQHMMDTLNRLMNFHGPKAKAIIWEHNTHIGDARATDMADSGMFNIGQLAREHYANKDVVLVGLGSYQGKVIAADYWGANMADMVTPPARENSWEDILQRVKPGNKLLILDELNDDENLSMPIDQRAIGVVYHPENESYNYVPSLITERYDAFLFFETTEALHPLHIKPDGFQMPETYPWGV